MELDHIVSKANDFGAARLKLDWWREELQSVTQGATRHPLSDALSLLLTNAANLQLMLAMLDGIENDVKKYQPDDVSGFQLQCDLLGGSFGELLSKISNTDGVGDAGNARILGGYDEAVTRICTLGAFLRRGFCPLPHFIDDGIKLSVATVKNASEKSSWPQTVARLLEQQSRQVKTILATAAHAKQISPVHRLAAQSLVLDAKMANQNYAVLNRMWVLLPIRRLWAAWRLR